jgi:hypothetical protein
MSDPWQKLQASIPWDVLRDEPASVVQAGPASTPASTLTPLERRKLALGFVAALLVGGVVLFALGRVSALASRPAEAPAVSPVPTVAPAALAAPLPLPTVTLMTPARERVATDQLPVICEDGKAQLGYSVPDVTALTVILTRHAGRCRVGGGAGWTAEEQVKWYETHKEQP